MPTDRVWKLMHVPHELLPVARTKRYEIAREGGLPVVEVIGRLFVRESALRQWLRDRERVRSAEGRCRPARRREPDVNQGGTDGLQRE
jgi:hypothetical protein